MIGHSNKKCHIKICIILYTSNLDARLSIYTCNSKSDTLCRAFFLKKKKKKKQEQKTRTKKTTTKNTHICPSGSGLTTAWIMCEKAIIYTFLCLEHLRVRVFIWKKAVKVD